MNKKPIQEQEKFQPSYDCTVFTDCTMDTFNVYSVPGSGLVSTPTPSIDGSEVADGHQSSGSKSLTIASKSGPSSKGIGGLNLLSATNASVSNASSPMSDKNSNSKPCAFNIFSDMNENSFDLNFTNFTQMHLTPTTLANTHLSPNASAEVTMKWLKENRFDAYLNTFSQFSGTDILVLSKEDMIKICSSLTDGIRLYNALHTNRVKSKLTIFICSLNDDVFRAIYLDSLTVSELQAKIVSSLQVPKCTYLKRLCIVGPAGVKILVSDDVVKNLSDESLYMVELTKGELPCSLFGHVMCHIKM